MARTIRLSVLTVCVHVCSSISDQLFGDQHQHTEIRKVIERHVGASVSRLHCARVYTHLVAYTLCLQRIVNFIELKRDDFEPFMEDEEKFEHVRRCPFLGAWYTVHVRHI